MGSSCSAPYDGVNFRRYSDFYFVHKENDMRLSKVTLFVCAMFLIFWASDLRAQTSVCDGIADSGERLKCKHGRLLDQQERMINNLEKHFGQVIPAEDFERLKRAHGRAKQAKDRMNSKHFKSLVKKNPEICDLAEFPGSGDGDGICEPGEKCLGKDGGICKIKGKDREGCVEICGGDGETMEDEVDVGYLAEVEGNYDDVTKSLEGANDALENNGRVTASTMGSIFNASQPAEACKAAVDGLAIADVLATNITRVASTWTRGIVDIAGRGCDQTVAGFNAAAACAGLEACAMAQAVIADLTQSGFNIARTFVDNSTQTCLSSLSADLQDTKATLGSVASTTSGSSTQLSAVVTDVQNIKDTVDKLTINLNALSATLNAVQKRTAELFEAMNTRFNGVETLLNTPQGQREGFPSRK